MITRSKKRKLNEMAGGAPVGRQPLTKRKYVPGLQLQQFLEKAMMVLAVLAETRLGMFLIVNSMFILCVTMSIVSIR